MSQVTGRRGAVTTCSTSGGWVPLYQLTDLLRRQLREHCTERGRRGEVSRMYSSLLDVWAEKTVFARAGWGAQPQRELENPVCQADLSSQVPSL